MARIIVRCQYTGHYVFTGVDTEKAPAIVGGRIYCPYCATDHVWSCRDVRAENDRRSKPLVRQAS